MRHIRHLVDSIGRDLRTGLSKDELALKYRINQSIIGKIRGVLERGESSYWVLRELENLYRFPGSKSRSFKTFTGAKSVLTPGTIKPVVPLPWNFAGVGHWDFATYRYINPAGTHIMLATYNKTRQVKIYRLSDRSLLSTLAIPIDSCWKTDTTLLSINGNTLSEIDHLTGTPVNSWSLPNMNTVDSEAGWTKWSRPAKGISEDGSSVILRGANQWGRWHLAHVDFGTDTVTDYRMEDLLAGLETPNLQTYHDLHNFDDPANDTSFLLAGWNSHVGSPPATDGWYEIQYSPVTQTLLNENAAANYWSHPKFSNSRAKDQVIFNLTNKVGNFGPGVGLAIRSTNTIVWSHDFSSAYVQHTSALWSGGKIYIGVTSTRGVNNAVGVYDLWAGAINDTSPYEGALTKRLTVSSPDGAGEVWVGNTSIGPAAWCEAEGNGTSSEFGVLI